MKPIIVQIVQHLRPGGIETMAIDLLQQLNSKAEVYIFSLEGDEESALSHWPHLKQYKERLVFFKKAPGIRPGLISNIKKALRRLNANAVHTHHIGPLLYGGIAARQLRMTHVHTEHDAWHLNEFDNRILQNILLRFVRPQLIADCDVVAEELLYRFPFSQPKTILNGVDLKRFLPATQKGKLSARRKLDLPLHKYLVGCAARLESVKGHRYLLEAISKTYSDIHLVLAGSGSLREELEHQAKQLGIQHRITFLGHLDDTLPFYHAIDLFCLPSLNEGLPLSPLEAQACNIPAVITDVGGCRSIVCPETSVLVKAGSVYALTNAIIRVHYTQTHHQPRSFVYKTGSLEKTAEAYFCLLSDSTNHLKQAEV